MNNPPKSLEDSIKRLGARLDQLRAYLAGDESAATRVANAPESSLEDATDRARKHWDKLEGRKSSIPPRAP